MKTILVILSAMYAAAAIGAETQATPYRQFYLVNGKETDAASAIINALNGRAAFKCVAVTAAVSKSGTSIAVKNVKKPKISKD